jgi:hypothetical protein
VVELGAGLSDALRQVRVTNRSLVFRRHGPNQRTYRTPLPTGTRLRELGDGDLDRLLAAAGYIPPQPTDDHATPLL